MPLNMKTLVLGAAAALAACTHPADVSRPLTEVADKNAHFAVTDAPGGFAVDLRYSRYQFVPEAGALLTACRSLATARARDEARARGREIEPVDETTVRVSVGRNGLTGRTACRAHADAVWRR